jgi:hypothetical protein
MKFVRIQQELHTRSVEIEAGTLEEAKEKFKDLDSEDIENLTHKEPIKYRHSWSIIK